MTQQEKIRAKDLDKNYNLVKISIFIDFNKLTRQLLIELFLNLKKIASLICLLYALNNIKLNVYNNFLKYWFFLT